MIKKVTMSQQLIVMSTLKKYSFYYTKECSYIYIISKREKVFEMKSYIVVGSGILGASTAYHLAKAGANVTIVHRQQLGQATDAGAGIVCPWLSRRRNKAWYKIVKGGARYYSSLIQQLEEDGETDTGYNRVGAISLHTDEKKLDRMEERAYKRREDAPEIGEITRLSAEETKIIPSIIRRI